MIIRVPGKTVFTTGAPILSLCSSDGLILAEVFFKNLAKLSLVCQRKGKLGYFVVSMFGSGQRVHQYEPHVFNGMHLYPGSVVAVSISFNGRLSDIKVCDLWEGLDIEEGKG